MLFKLFLFSIHFEECQRLSFRVAQTHIYTVSFLVFLSSGGHPLYLVDPTYYRSMDYYGLAVRT